MASLPPQRLALSVPVTRQVRARDFSLFVEHMKKLGVPEDEPVTVDIMSDGTLKFHVSVPDQNPPKKTPHRQRVEAQIEGRRAKIAKGEEVPGYMPPVKPRKVVKVPRQAKRKIVRRSARGRTGGTKDE